MATNSDDISTENVTTKGISRLHLKRKVASVKNHNFENKLMTSEDSSDEGIFPSVLVKVEVCEVDETITPLDLEKKTPPKSNTKSTKVRRKRKKKKQSDRATEAGLDEKEESNCQICGRKFSSPYNLQRHVVVHSGEMKCPLCGVQFKTRNYFVKHMTTHDPMEKCNQCDAKFHTKMQLTKHINKHFNDTPPDSRDDLDDPWVSTEPLNSTHNRSLSRDELNDVTQIAIVSKMHQGRSITDICQLYAITPDVVNEIWNDRDKFILPKKVGKRSTRYMNSILEPLVYDWYNMQKNKDEHVTGKMIQHIAENMARENGFIHFNAGNKWLEQFKKRYSIYLKLNKRADFSSWPQESVWKTKFLKEQWSELRQTYADEEIYTADEVGVYYNPSKSRVKKFGGKKYIQGCATDRLAIFLCANMSGGDKRKLLVCGTDDPLKRSSRNPNSLPVDYRRHSKCQFTTTVFEEYILKWNDTLQATCQKALLILDRASIHSKLKMSNLKLVFIPWKSANGLMPIKNGIYARFRSEFRNMLVEHKVLNVLKGIDRNVTCLEALEMIGRAWERTPSSVITKSFVDIGYESYKIHIKPMSDSGVSKWEKNAEMYCNILKDYDVEQFFTETSMLDMYISVEEDLLTGQGTNPTLFGGNHKAIEPVVKTSEDLPINTEKPLTNEKEIYIKKTRALADLEIVRKYLQTSDTSCQIFSHFLDVEKAVMDNFVKLNN